jgi:hypothetical protein
MALLLIMFLLPREISVSLAGRHFTGGALGTVLLCTSFVGFFAGIFGILVLKGYFKLIGALLAFVSMVDLTYVFVGYAIH